MNRKLTRYIQVKGIDSFQKLQVLLFLHQHPNLKSTGPELAEHLYIGDTVLLTKIIRDLYLAGLVERTGNRYKVRDEPDVQSYLQDLSKTFEDPLARQELLTLVRKHTRLNPPVM